MVFNSKEELLYFLKRMQLVGSGSQGSVYYNKNNNIIYKIYDGIFYEFLDDEFYEINEKELLKFLYLKNDTYKFPLEAIKLENKIIGYTNNYVRGKLLCDINPLLIKFDDFVRATLKVEKDIKFLTDNNVLTFDVIYNIMYGNKKIKIIDTDEYSYNYSLSYDELLSKNKYCFNLGIMLFLVDSYFDDFIDNSRLLTEMYNSKDTDLKEFLILFKNMLSEYADKEITRLVDAKTLLNRKRRFPKYIRNFR